MHTGHGRKSVKIGGFYIYPCAAHGCLAALASAQRPPMSARQIGSLKRRCSCVRLFNGYHSSNSTATADRLKLKPKESATFCKATQVPSRFT